jgi:hypothetical protein
MTRPTLLAAFCVALLPGLLFAQDKTTVYKSKTADGTSVYSQVQTQGSEARGVQGRDPDLPEPAQEVPKTPAQVACEGAQNNLELLKAGGPLQRDKDGDGVMEVMTPEEIATERDLAERSAAAYCTPPAA